MTPWRWTPIWNVYIGKFRRLKSIHPALVKKHDGHGCPLNAALLASKPVLEELFFLNACTYIFVTLQQHALLLRLHAYF